MMLAATSWFQRPSFSVSLAVVGATVLIPSGLYLSWLIQGRANYGRNRQLPGVVEVLAPYPKDALPGGRDVESPYGTIRVFEWGEESGGKVLLIPGIAAPVLTLFDLAQELSASGFRVMIFGEPATSSRKATLEDETGIELTELDLFGRGYSENPGDLQHDERLYVTQILLVLASSPLPWTGADAFRLIGYSFGGGIAVAFTRYFPNMIESLSLIAPCGLVRESHRNWQQGFLYSTGVFPRWFLENLTRRRLMPKSAAPDETTSNTGTKLQMLRRGTSDATGGDTFDHALVAKGFPGITVAMVMRWQIDSRPNFIPAFMSSMRCAPIYAQQVLWSRLATTLRIKNSKNEAELSRNNKVLFILGRDDPVIIQDELKQDATAVLGEDLIEFVQIDAGHELVFTKAAEIREALLKSWM